MANFAYTKGDRFPVITDTIVDGDGNPVDLTGCTVVLGYQNVDTGRVRNPTATIVDPLAGTISYSPDTSDMVDVGDFQFDWKITYPDGRAEHIPGGGVYFTFSVALAASDTQPIASFRRFIRTLLGDNHPTIKTYESAQLDDAVRLVVNLGQIPGVTLSTDGASLVPPLYPNDPSADVAKNWARVVLYSAKRFASTSSSSYSFRTRALSETFGEQRDMVFELLQDVYELDNGDQCSAPNSLPCRRIC